MKEKPNKLPVVGERKNLTPHGNCHSVFLTVGGLSIFFLLAGLLARELTPLCTTTAIPRPNTTQVKQGLRDCIVAHWGVLNFHINWKQSSVFCPTEGTTLWSVRCPFGSMLLLRMDGHQPVSVVSLSPDSKRHTKVLHVSLDRLSRFH